jgi:hypothetical protein
MKAQLFFALSITCFLFTACQKEADLAQPSASFPDAEALKSYASDHYSVDGTPRDGLTRDYCIDLSTTNWLVGHGTFEPLRQTAADQRTVRSIESGMYIIEASGDGMSADYARSSSELKMTFNSRTNHVSGSMITKFFHGEVLVQEFDGGALVLIDRYAMILKANVPSAKFDNGSEVLDLVKGELIIALPLKPEGWFETNIYTQGMFCTGVVD